MSFPSYPAYKDSGVEWLGEVPRHWPVYSLKRTVDGCVNGLWGEEPDGENDIAVIRVADFERSFATVGLDKLTYRSITAKEKQSRLIKSGDLLIEKSGGGEKTLVGCVVLFKHEFEAITSNFVARMRPLSEFESQFLCYAFGNLYHGRVNYPSVKQVTGIQNLDAESYLQQRFCFPARVEQTLIARFLDHETARIDALIEEQQRLIELLKEKRQAVISHAVTKGLDPTVSMKDSGVEWLGEVPAHWDVKALRYLGECQNGINIGGEAFGSGSPFVSYGDVHKNDVLPAEVTGLVQSSAEDRQRYSIDYGDVFFTRTSETVDEIGFSATCLQKLQNAVFAGFLIRFRPSGNSLTPGFSKYYFRNQRLRIFFNKEMNLVTRASLSQDLLKQLPVTLPPVIEQIKISDFLDKVTAEFASLLEQGLGSIDLLIERRSALISAAVTGKIDVRGWQPSASVPSPELELEAV